MSLFDIFFLGLVVLAFTTFGVSLFIVDRFCNSGSQPTKKTPHPAE